MCVTMSWAASNNGQNYGIRTEGNVTVTSSAVSLFSVAAGSYATPGSFGSGAPMIANAGRQDDNNSALIIRKEDCQVDFAIKMQFDVSQGVALFPGSVTGQEVRICPRNQGFPTPIRRAQSATLPPINLDSYQPLFLDVEVLNSNGAPIAIAWPPSAATTPGLGQLKARYLHGGQLALVNVNYAVNNITNTTPVLASDFNALVGAAGTSTIVISVRGSYLADSPTPH